MTKIEWTEQTWNPVAGCTWASAGCDHCYAAVMTRRLEAMGQEAYAGLTTHKHFNGVLRPLPDKLDVPLRRKKPTMWFVNSMSDLFHKDVPFEFIDQVFAVMALCPQHTFQVLTKRPERMAEYGAGRDLGARIWHVHRDKYQVEIPDIHGPADGITWGLKPLRNVWLGTSIENQEQADKRIPHLLKSPAALRFLSCEPLLGAVTLQHLIGRNYPYIDWVIVGGESGHGARPCNVAWVRDIVSQCKAAGVPVFVKQMGSVCLDNDGESRCSWPGLTQFKIDGEHCRVLLKDGKGGNWNEWPDDIRVREFPAEVHHA